MNINCKGKNVNTIQFQQKKLPIKTTNKHSNIYPQMTLHRTKEKKNYKKNL